MRQYARIAAVIALGLVAQPVVAADYGYQPTINAPSMIPPEEIGTGWYLRGDVAVNRTTRIDANWRDDRFTTMKAADSRVFGGGIGYKYNGWLRGDLTADHLDPFTVRGRAKCRNAGCLPGDVSSEQTTMNAWLMMANGYLDFSSWAGITPYVGGGVGMAYISTGKHLSYNPGDKIADDSFGASQRWSLAASAMAGASYDLGNGFQLDAGYKYLWIDKAETGTSGNVKGQVQYRDITSHQVRVGLRYFVY
ncbi:outer membrane protein [Prosthecomicrobium hirschii]|uniref:outer membrane protein n=1 Tax=Prosthecodimorpha hirschii TaxID=665126 RepID=UPI002220FE12|nr:outer membrane beta-barrel protein [Prosthecomicrobium hirschii]MCW1843458.1 outer membrane beta-barrel protein [Prosthecomicrobium hirschii]